MDPKKIFEKSAQKARVRKQRAAEIAAKEEFEKAGQRKPTKSKTRFELEYERVEVKIVAFLEFAKEQGLIESYDNPPFVNSGKNNKESRFHIRGVDYNERAAIRSTMARTLPGHEFQINLRGNGEYRKPNGKLMEFETSLRFLGIHAERAFKGFVPDNANKFKFAEIYRSYDFSSASASNFRGFMQLVADVFTHSSEVFPVIQKQEFARSKQARNLTQG